MILLRLSGFAMSMVPSLLAAAPASSGSIPGLSAGSTGTGVVLEMVALLAAVVLLILGLGWLIKRVGNFPVAGKGMVKILGGVSLGPRERAVVLEAGSKRLLVGVAPGRVQTLCVLEETEAGDELFTEDDSAGFSTQLESQMQDESK